MTGEGALKDSVMVAVTFWFLVLAAVIWLMTRFA